MPDAICSDEERLLETKWHLLPRDVSWIPHADDGNVAGAASSTALTLMRPSLSVAPNNFCIVRTAISCNSIWGVLFVLRGNLV